jgi:predicted dehydrogenase
LQLPTVSRRTFVGTLGVGTTLGVLKQPAQATKSVNDQVVMGMIGVGNQGTSRLKEFMQQPDVRIAAICDVDRRHLDRAIALVEQEKGYKPQAFGDFRRLLAVKEIDAVTVVTSDHWHAIPTISAFEADKDVFVKKPLSYTVAEGRAIADA